MKHFLLLCVAANLLAISICAQGSFTATVLDVVDGRTVVLQVGGGRLNAQLQYIETPEPEQALHKVVKEHLAKLAVGKAVEFRTVRIVGGKTIGRMTLDGVDLSAQLIRDGAAWHEPKEISGQRPEEAIEYEAMQAQAKNEKRGVWSGAILKTPWEVRAEKENHERALEAARRITHPTRVGVGEFHSDTRRPSGNHTATAGPSQRMQMDNWVSVFAGVGKETYGIRTYTDPKGRFSAVYTSAAMIDFHSTSDKERIECRAMLISPTVNNGGTGRVFLLAFQAIASDYRISKGKSSISVIADGRRVALGAPFGMRGQGLVGAQEIAFYRISWATLQKIGNAKKVEVRLDKRSAPLKDEARELIRQLADATG